ncbi:MAG: DNA cytosine methyltransferase [Deltaproteobacteria bacterium]|nr:DNA cytosine methyltransferase [Deltaproteobacteria bacterium]
MTGLVLFGGAGGADLGLRAAGIELLRSVEWDRDAHATAVAAGLPSVHGDVRDLALYEGLPPVDLLWASPPCQAFSTAGKRLGAADERNGWPWTLDVVDHVRPRWVLCENVPGLTHHRGDCDGRGPADDCPGCYWHRVVVPAFEARFGSVQWTIIDAADHGVPQRRHRVFLVAGPRAIRWPRPTHADPATLAQAGLFGPALQPWRTVREALGLDVPVRHRSPSAGTVGHLDEPSANCSTKGVLYAETPACDSRHPLAMLYRRGRDGGARYEPHDIDEPCCALRGAPGGSSQPFLIDSRHPPSTPGAPAPTIRSGGDGHSAPPAYLEVGVDAVIRRQRPASAPKPDTSLDAPAPTVPTDHTGSLYLTRRTDGGHAAPPAYIEVDRPALTLRAQGARPPRPPGRRSTPSRESHGGSGLALAFGVGVGDVVAIASGDVPLLQRGEPGYRDFDGFRLAPEPRVWGGGSNPRAPGEAHKRTVRDITDEPATTLPAVDAGNNALTISTGGESHAASIRRLTVEECAALQAFPPGYPFQGTKTSMYKQVGNAVCPPVAEALARAVVEGAR